MVFDGLLEVCDSYDLTFWILIFSQLNSTPEKAGALKDKIISIIS
jgi:hypothetical protein